MIYSLLFTSLLTSLLFGQETSSPPQPGRLQAVSPNNTNDPSSDPPVEQKRLFGIIPNNRTSSTLQNYSPLTTLQKFGIAKEDALDRGTFVLAAAFAGISDLGRNEPSFGHGAQAYGRYFITSYADYAIGDFMTEGIYPTLLHQDPRYFRKGEGGTWSRLRYSIFQIFSTQTDTGGRAVNYSELLGNATSVAISQAYYPDTRDVSDAATSWGTQIWVDMASNILKEFSPDIYRMFARKKRHNP